MSVTAWLLPLWRSQSTTERRGKQEQPGKGSRQTDRQMDSSLLHACTLRAGSFLAHSLPMVSKIKVGVALFTNNKQNYYRTMGCISPEAATFLSPWCEKLGLGLFILSMFLRLHGAEHFIFTADLLPNRLGILKDVTFMLRQQRCPRNKSLHVPLWRDRGTESPIPVVTDGGRCCWLC